MALFLVLCSSPPSPPFCFFFPLCCRFPCAPFVPCFLWFPAPGALGLGAVCCLSCSPRASRPSVRFRHFCVACLAAGCCLVVAPPPVCVSRFFLPPLHFWCFFSLLLSAPPLSLAFSDFRPRVPWDLALGSAFFSPLLLGSPCALAFLVSPAWPLAAPWWLGPRPPPPPLRRAVFVAAVLCRVFFFRSPRAPPLSPAFFGFWPRLPWALALCFVCFLGLPLLGPLCAPASFVSLALSLLGPSWLLPPPPCRSVLRSFFFVPQLSLAFSGFRPWLPWASALRVVCFVGFLLLGSLCALASFLLPACPLAAPRWLLPPPPLLCPAVFVASARCCVPCAVLCRVPGCALCRPVLCRCVLCCFAAPVWCRCLLCRALWRCPSPWGSVLCGALFSGVPRRSVCFVLAWWCVPLSAALLCAVCVLGCCAVRTLSSQLFAVQCFAVLVRLRCAVRVVRAVAGAWCCGVLLCVVVFPLVCCGAVLGLVGRGCLLVPCCGALLSVFLC